MPLPAPALPRLRLCKMAMCVVLARLPRRIGAGVTASGALGKSGTNAYLCWLFAAIDRELCDRVRVRHGRTVVPPSPARSHRHAWNNGNARALLFPRGSATSVMDSEARILADQQSRLARLRQRLNAVEQGIADTQEALNDMGAEMLPNGSSALSVSYDDVCSVPSMRDKTLFAVRAPPGTTLEVPGPDLQLLLSLGLPRLLLPLLRHARLAHAPLLSLPVLCTHAHDYSRRTRSQTPVRSLSQGADAAMHSLQLIFCCWCRQVVVVVCASRCCSLVRVCSLSTPTDSHWTAPSTCSY